MPALYCSSIVLIWYGTLQTCDFVSTVLRHAPLLELQKRMVPVGGQRLRDREAWARSSTPHRRQ